MEQCHYLWLNIVVACSDFGGSMALKVKLGLNVLWFCFCVDTVGVCYVAALLFHIWNLIIWYIIFVKKKLHD